MPHYKYRATDASGTTVKATADSHNERELREALLLQNLDVTHIKVQRRLSDIELGKKRIPAMEIAQFSRQMATFVRAGISIPEGLDIIIESTSSKRFQEILREVSEAIVRGVPFSESLAEHEQLLPPYFIGLVRAGELTGRIDTVLEQLADYVERDLDARSKVKSALTYPAIVMGMSVVTVAVLLIVVLPKFSKFFKEFHTKLPPVTRTLIATSHVMSTFWFVFPALLLAGAVTATWMKKSPRGRNVRDRLLLRLPVLGEIVKFAVLERFCRVFGSMTRAGVSLPEAIQAAADSTNNTVYEATLLDVQEQMLAGAGIAEPIANSGKFPRIVVQLLRVGEATGSLDHQLENAANYYNGQLTYKLKKMTTLIEPAVVIFMGAIVGFVALALVSAMYGIYHAPSLMKP